jgi:hypothetical protein
MPSKPYPLSDNVHHVFRILSLSNSAGEDFSEQARV